MTKVFIGAYKGSDIYLDDKEDKAAIALITHQQDEIERLTRVDPELKATMGRIIEREGS